MGKYHINRQPYYNGRNILKTYSNEELLKNFKSEFERIHPTSSCEYNALRKYNQPQWEYIAKRYGVSKWCEICKLANVNLYNTRAYRPSIKTKHILKSDLLIEEINKEIDKIKAGI